MKKYLNYKDSGVEWLGEIPEHWENRKISRSFKTIGSGTTPQTNEIKFYENGKINWLITGDLNDGILEETSKKITDLAFEKYSTLKIFPKGSLAIALYGATIGKVSLLDLETCTNQACCVIGDSEYFNEKFTFFWFLANKQNIINLSYGGGQPNISQDIIRSLKMTSPPLPEQEAIANYLDEKTAKIDLLVELKEKQIELLKEQRTALINQAVTKGLNPNVKMKDSGIEWLGEIPEHWEKGKVRFYSFNLDSKRIPLNGLQRSSFEGEFPYYGATGIIDKVKEFIFEGEFLLIGEDGAPFGIKNKDVAFIASGKFWANNHVHVLKPHKINCKFLCNLINRTDFTNFVQGSTREKLTQSDLSNIPILLPPLPEQEAIANYLDEKTAKIDESISKAENQIELLKEYRTALISEAVTGKIDVRS